MADNSTSTSGGNTFYECTQVSPMCPVEATTLGYYPNKPLNSFIAAAFGLAMIIQLVFGIWKRTWPFMSFIVAGCALELAGYGGRIALSSNPYNQQAFETQICAIILAPTLICISIYLTLKHLSLALNPTISRVRPKWLPFIFVPADVSCLLVQAIGGAIAASAGTNNPNVALLNAGNRAIIAGIALQVVVLLAFGCMCLDYWVRARRWVHGADVTPEALALWTDRKFRTFGYAMVGAYVCVQIRCIYRVAEMAGGWGNYIMQDQPSFTVLDSFMMLICVYLLSCFPPGIYFPPMARGSKASREKDHDAAVDLGEKTHDAEHGGLKSAHESKEQSATP
ncbi:Sphingoid long-chain base transporter RSB1 [Cytospora mali]|uniref:Sphingoid long-chain base transporter RSB1 n=1 Tax=Cytospora mali TaxID=578113 RepID=A0A194VVR2_CYTMA|nr:Sphingoid long-chain base transporter RSB1 [Valsa mali]